MIADPRSSNLATNFAGQWLRLRNLEAVRPNVRLYPDFDDNLRQAFRTETELFIDSVVREDRSALDLLRADYTFLNERLAKHYGIPNVYGSRFRRVMLGENSKARWIVETRQRPVRYVLRDTDVTGHSRGLGLGQHLRRASTAATAERAGARRELGGRQRPRSGSG